MHAEAFGWVARLGSSEALEALDLGGRDVNGSCRLHWSAASWTVLDIDPGPGVDIVADAATWRPDRAYDSVLCTEVLEHTPDGKAIVATAHEALRPGGRLVLTCASIGRAPHSGGDGGPLPAGEYYGNVDPDDLQAWLDGAGFEQIEVTYAPAPCDVYATAIRAEGEPDDRAR